MPESSTPNEALRARITDYLGGGGLFNPELANHDAVRDLLIDCRDALAAVPPAGETGEPVAWDIYANGYYIVTARDVEQRDNAAKYQREERGIVAEVRPLYAAPVPAPVEPPSAEAVEWLRWVAGQCPAMSDYKGMSHEHAAELLRFVEGK